MIRVLHYGLDSKLGGIETYLYKLYTHIDRDEFQFDFLAVGDKEPCWYKEFTDMGSDFYRVTPRTKNLFKNRAELFKLFKEEHFDIVHCHLNTLSYIAPVQVAIKNRIPVIVHSRNAGASKSIISNLLHSINSAILPRNKITMLAVSNLAGTWLFGNNAKFKVINNGIDIEKYTYSEVGRNKVRKEFGLKNELIIVHLGAMRKQKNHMFLLDIFNEVLKIKPNSKLLLIGEGELKKEISNKIYKLRMEDNVILTGKRNDVCDILSAGDMFLFPSFFEGFPNAVLEAETTGLPCLISSEITNEVMINEDCYAMSLNVEAKAWADKLLSIKLNENRKISSQNIKNQGYSVEDEIRRVVSIYRDLSIDFNL